MPLRLRFEAIAARDLLDIVRFIASRGDRETAEKFGDRLVAKCQQLTSAPGAGAPYLPRRGCRKIMEGAYKIIYTEQAGTVWILRIWDGRRGSEPPLPR